MKPRKSREDRGEYDGDELLRRYGLHPEDFPGAIRWRKEEVLSMIAMGIADEQAREGDDQE